ncbi:MAG: toxin-antitoxin system HicB family antitoxin [bacterium]
MKAGDRYLKIVEWSDEDQCYVGFCPLLMLGGIHGDNETEVYAELCQAVEEWIAIHARDGLPLPPATAGKDYSGKFVVRVGRELHRELAIHALRERVSLNTYCARVLREGRASYGCDALAPAASVLLLREKQNAYRVAETRPVNKSANRKTRDPA